MIQFAEAPPAPDPIVPLHIVADPAPIPRVVTTMHPAWRFVRTLAVTIAVVALAMTVGLVFVSRLQHATSQTRLGQQMRAELAAGTAPLSAYDFRGHLLSVGDPVALLRVPSLGIDEVVVEGTTGAALETGPGHLRSTAFPGGTGTSVIYGRRAAFGGPFGELSHVRKGSVIKVTTGAGTSRYRVVGIRHAGDRYTPAPARSGRLILATATGAPFLPSGVVWVDANLISRRLPTEASPIGSVPPRERPLGTDFSTLWALAFWLQALAALAGGAIWTWHRRGHARAWVIFSAPLLLSVVAATSQLARMLPNLT